MFIGPQFGTVLCKKADSVCCPLSYIFSVFLQRNVRESSRFLIYISFRRL